MIGILDSGICGLTVARAVKRQLPGCDILYLGDTARMPYGARHPDTIRAYGMQGARFLIQAGAKCLVVSCHTLASAAGAHLRDQLDIPIFTITDATTAAAIRASRRTKSGISFGVLGTRTTVFSRIYEEKISALCPEARIYGVSAPLLVPFVEEGRLTQPETAMLVKKYIHPLKTRQIDTLILGCTHLVFLEKTIQQKIGRQVALVDGIRPLAREVAQFFTEGPGRDMPMAGSGQLRACVSEKTDHLECAARRYFHGNITLERMECSRGLPSA